MATRFELHGAWLSGPVYKVGLMLALCGEPFDYVHVNLRGGDHKKPEFLKRQRYGQVPMLVDLSNGLELTQAASILEYLSAKLGKFAGATEEERIRAREWMYWDYDRLAPHVGRARSMRLGFRSMPFDVAAMHHNEASAALKVLDDHLDSRNWLVGSAPTIADIEVYGSINYAAAGGFDLAQYKHLSAWTARFMALKGFGTQEELLPKESRKA